MTASFNPYGTAGELEGRQSRVGWKRTANKGLNGLGRKRAEAQIQTTKLLDLKGPPHGRKGLRGAFHSGGHYRQLLGWRWIRSVDFWNVDVRK